jgi:hypothetical protein
LQVLNPKVYADAAPSFRYHRLADLGGITALPTSSKPMFAFTVAHRGRRRGGASGSPGKTSGYRRTGKAPGRNDGRWPECGRYRRPRSIGGIAREYFTRLVGRYGKTLAWDRPFEGKGGLATGGAFAIEPHTAEGLFDELASEAKVPVHFGARLARVRKDGARIVELVTETGSVFRAKMFIDATYEGDLLARAGVSYTLQREGNAKYGETYNGIHYAAIYQPRLEHKKPGTNGRVPGGQGVWDRDFPLDPYVIPGDPNSGLLPLVQAGQPGVPAAAPASGVLLPAVLDNGGRPILIVPARRLHRDVTSWSHALSQPAWLLATWIARFRNTTRCRIEVGLHGDFWRQPAGSKLGMAGGQLCLPRRDRHEHENYHRGLLHFWR